MSATQRLSLVNFFSISKTSPRLCSPDPKNFGDSSDVLSEVAVRIMQTMVKRRPNAMTPYLRRITVGANLV
jgi:hypothetical protein